ncbi:MAG: ABC transporter permease [Treponema sp.]|jgi:lipoprotein-releasing system permease protein|nr:ABC transporter permease [Treponema sp.]
MLRSLRWIGFIARRYVSRKQKNAPTTILAIIGIAVGVLALIVIIAVMNGFQMGFIESILELSSYHVRVEGDSAENEQKLLDTIQQIATIPGVTAIVPFKEFQGLVRGKHDSQEVAILRGVPFNALSQDAGMRDKIRFESGSFDLKEEQSVLLGAELARRLGVRIGDEVTLISISGILSEEIAAEDTVFTVRGIFRTDFYEYDLGWGFINIESASTLGGGLLVLGIKLHNRWLGDSYVPRIRDIVTDSGGTVTSWRDYNKAFFGALRTEKLLMFVLVGLIFVVVALNIFQAQRRNVMERREEIGLLKAVGGGELAIRFIFVSDSFVVGGLGTLIGLSGGLLIASNISAFFSLLETIANTFIHIVNRIMRAGTADFSIFSPTVFYIKEIPSRIIPHEVVLICTFGLCSALIAAWFASRKTTKMRPAEVLRDE